MEQLHGNTVLVTGSTDGVGRLVFGRLGEAGARVLVHGRNPERGAQVVAEIQKAGSSGTFFRADLASLAEMRHLADAVQDATDRLDILINNAGIVRPVSTVEQGAEAIVNLAVSPALEGRSGLYFNGLREARAHSQAYDPEARQRLQALSLDLTRC